MWVAGSRMTARGDHRTGQAAAAHLVDARDVHESHTPAGRSRTSAWLQSAPWLLRQCGV